MKRSNIAVIPQVTMYLLAICKNPIQCHNVLQILLISFVISDSKASSCLSPKIFRGNLLEALLLFLIQSCVK